MIVNGDGMRAAISKLHTDTVPGMPNNSPAISAKTAQIKFNDRPNWGAAESFKEEAITG